MKPRNVVRIYRPELTAEERERRMKLIEDAAVRLVQATAQARREHDRA